MPGFLHGFLHDWFYDSIVSAGESRMFGRWFKRTEIYFEHLNLTYDSPAGRTIFIWRSKYY